MGKTVSQELEEQRGNINLADVMPLTAQGGLVALK